MSFLQTVVKFRGKSLTLFMDAVAAEVYSGLGEIGKIKEALPQLTASKCGGVDNETERSVIEMKTGADCVSFESGDFISDRTGTDG